MPSKNILNPSQAIGALQVLAYSKGSITRPFYYTVEQYYGQLVEVGREDNLVRIRNIGEQGTMYVDLVDRDNSSIVVTQTFTNVPAGGEVTINFAKMMPAKDWNLQLRVQHMEYDPGTYQDIFVTDDYENFVVTFLVAVLTTLTLSPIGSARPSESYVYSGKLTRNDSGAGLSGQQVLCEREEASVYKLIGTATTLADGTYVFTANAPTVPGSYACRTRFTGTPGYFAASMSEISKMGVSLALDTRTILAITLPVAAGILVLAALNMGKK